MSTQSVVTSIRVIEAISELQPVGLSELARHLSLSKATVLRVLTTLEELGWVAQGAPPTSTWATTFHAYAVVARSGIGTNLRDVALGPMNHLQLDTTETVHLCVPDGESLIVIERLDTPHVLRAFLALGTRIPLNASGTGLAFLAASSDSFVEEYLEGPLEQRTARTHTDQENLWAELRQIRTRGYSINEGGLSDGITSLGAAIVDPLGAPVGSVSISGPSNRIVPEKYEEFGAAVAETAKVIGSQLTAHNR
ncbi:IclR family transcriptional regulator [Arthrobacter crystallopoietes]|uniref:Transcriptional regulator, IclR family n=1 Tax=Crystallibacter crystallopoietes TaxID=37928 RepID=A0A1H1BS74_9MICC|nr:IclR family transcriptional regulator [Arthrobacter crystallopoietes]AUI51041.1 IclR family transcriptional regulator [Arthrobacter crystallopoietes]SDQ54781.1 transcriptional regulator, IclR family [Arthrobacter crystallopoietes]